MSSGQPDKVVRVTLNSSGLPVPDQDPIQVKKDNQKVRWCADFDFRIEVAGYSDVTPDSGGSGCAFRVTSGKFSEIRNYKYSIIANGVVNDPDIDVRP
ncbi:MAG: hypothetical protein ABI779_12250 [Acidobacteriota bacterium]